jgi:hypothetical protein
MKKLFSLAILALLCTNSFGQKITNITFTGMLGNSTGTNFSQTGSAGGSIGAATAGWVSAIAAPSVNLSNITDMTLTFESFTSTGGKLETSPSPASALPTDYSQAAQSPLGSNVYWAYSQNYNKVSGNFTTPTSTIAWRKNQIFINPLTIASLPIVVANSASLQPGYSYSGEPANTNSNIQLHTVGQAVCLAFNSAADVVKFQLENVGTAAATAGALIVVEKSTDLITWTTIQNIDIANQPLSVSASEKQNYTLPVNDITARYIRIKITGVVSRSTRRENIRNIEVTPAPTTWTGSVWTNGTPSASADAIIDGDLSSTSSFSAKSLTVNATKTLTVASGSVTVAGALVNNGTIIVENNANLVQTAATNTNSGIGTTIIKRNSNPLSRLDYTIWSSPVLGTQTLEQFSPKTSQSPSRFYNYSESQNSYSEIATPTTDTFGVGAGYLIRMPNDHPTTATVWNGQFSGVPNNGTITRGVSKDLDGYNMIGNPYPSTIDAQAFITENTANIESSLYFWRKTNGASGTAYAVYNPLGATAATPSSEVPNGTIQVGQGFFVKAKSTSTLTFKNSMRIVNTNNQFFKTINTKQVEVQKDRLWLNLTNATGVFSQALVGYTADATSGVDMYDAKYFNDSPIALTSSINKEEYTIQSRPAFDINDTVALNFKTDVSGNYSIGLDHVDGLFAAGQDIYLVDSKTGTETNLKAGAYNFTAIAGIDNARFSLKYQKTLKIDAPAINENSVSVYKNNGMLYVNSGSVAINNISVFDINGVLLSEQKNVKTTTAIIKDLRAVNQVLIVKIIGEDNSVVTKKILN